MVEQPEQADVRSPAALVVWRLRKKAWSVRTGVLQYADGMVALYDEDEAVLFRVAAAHVAVRPMSGRRFALEAGGQTYVLVGLNLQLSVRPKALRLAERYGTQLFPPPAPGMAANPYWKWVNSSPSGPAGLAQHRQWQQYWLRLLTERGATRLPSRLWRRVDAELRRLGRPTPTHGYVATALIILWMLIPLLTLGYFTWITYLYAAIHVRRAGWLWFCALLVMALDGMYYWLTAIFDTPGESLGGIYAGMMAMLSLGGSFYAWQLRRYVFHRV